ncbi:transmembrane protein 79-like isoform X1 [Phycodurus eques]|uniref:transmembrane protein 79-like isoform X1 n=1 Tax=Phycodurus eques TaxID=693459 RepID=UPI002ACE49BE|nr:transmembrane protein 79-like isoform X1 [Phycodurus eques]XP_061552080.1 transmembrane protein 79-like isoform X1 [Phycodurus eques]XP_061552081.1 transmembrane protein 79-like isoform X1 [Phycodurus eques]
MDDEYLGAKMQGCGISEGACLTDEKEEPAESKTLRQTEKTVDPRRGFRQRGPRDDRALATGKSSYVSSSVRGRGCPSRDILKVGVSLTTSAIFFPFLVWGGFVFLPFDAPLLDGAPLRMLYVLRCSVFAATPVILGWLAMGVRRVRFGIVRPLLDDMEAAALEDLGVHAKYTRDSVSLFLMYFLQLVIMAMYLSQEQLKLVPLLAIVFALGRSVYWVAAAFGSSVRAFGSGLSFLPGLVMAVANLVFIFNVESSALFFSSPRHPQTLSPVGKQRFWG